MPDKNKLVVVVPAGLVSVLPSQSQSPAVNATEVILIAVPDVDWATADPEATELAISSPTFPAAALDPLVTPTVSGVVSVGLVAKTALPDPVVPKAAATPAAPVPT